MTILNPCCILGICCRKQSEQVRALADFIEEKEPILASAEERPLHRVAEVILENFDLVPKGLGAAQINAYEPYFNERARRNE